MVDLSARRVHPLSMSSLCCNFTICNFGKFEFQAKLFLRINLSSYFPASYFSEILWISRIADLQHWVFLKVLDILLMLSDEGGVIFPFPEQKEHDGGKSIIINFFKSLESFTFQ